MRVVLEANERLIVQTHAGNVVIEQKMSESLPFKACVSLAIHDGSGETKTYKLEETT